MASSQPESLTPAFDDDWEEWDGSTPFWTHCVAGSMAGVAEHVMVYPLDTVRTHIQVCAACHVHKAPGGSNKLGSTVAGAAAKSLKGGSSTFIAAAANNQAMANYGMWQTIRHLMNEPSAAAGVMDSGIAASATNPLGVTRLWRGVQSILIGCIPAHALYFSSYEIVKAATLDPETKQVTTYGSAMAGAVAVFSHDAIMAPLDTVKQRLQLGHYRGLSHALSTMIASEGWISLYRSFPVTLATNVPYGMVMVGTNEFLKQQWSAQDPSGSAKLTLPVTMSASAIAGFTASALTTPLDRIKTFLQTQQLAPACTVSASNIPPELCPLKQASGKAGPVVQNWQQAALRIYRHEGTAGFFRGVTPRVLSHTPAVAISWTTYETAKQYLGSIQFD